MCVYVCARLVCFETPRTTTAHYVTQDLVRILGGCHLSSRDLDLDYSHLTHVSALAGGFNYQLRPYRSAILEMRILSSTPGPQDALLDSLFPKYCKNSLYLSFYFGQYSNPQTNPTASIISIYSQCSFLKEQLSNTPTFTTQLRFPGHFHEVHRYFKSPSMLKKTRRKRLFERGDLVEGKMVKTLRNL